MPRLISKIVTAVSTACICIFLHACSAEEKVAPKPQAFEPVNHFLGVAAPVEELRNRNAALKAHLLPYAHVLPEKVQPAFRNLVRQAFADDQLYLAFCGYLNSRVDGDSLLAISEFLRDKNGRMMRARLAKALDPSLAAVRKEFSVEFPTDSAMLSTYALLEAGAGVANAHILVAAAEPTLEILNTVQPDSLMMQANDISSSLDTMQHKLQNFLTSEAMEAIAFAYGTMGADSVNRYADSFRTPLAEWYVRRIKEAYAAVFGAAITDYRDALQSFAATGDGTISRGNLLAFTQNSVLPETIVGITSAQVNGREERAFVRAARNTKGNLYLSLEFNNMSPELQLDIQTQFNGEGMYPISKEQAQMILNMEGLPEPFIIQLDAKSVNELWVNQYMREIGLFAGSFHLEFGGGDKGQAFTFDCPNFVASTIN